MDVQARDECSRRKKEGDQTDQTMHSQRSPGRRER